MLVDTHLLTSWNAVVVLIPINYKALICTALLCYHFSVQDRQLYSFSVPKCLPAAVDKVVTSWFQKVESLASASGLDVHLTRETVCLPSVSL